MDYTDLKNDIATTAMRSGDDEFEPAVPGFIRLAESRLNRQLRLSYMEKTSVGVLTDGKVALPADYLQYRTVSLGDCPLQFVVAGNRYTSGHLGGGPKFFTISGRAIEIFPKGHGDGDITMAYYGKIPALSDADPTNWLLDLAPEVYLYGALIEAASFMMDDQRIATWRNLYTSAIADLVNSDTRAKFARASVRVTGATP